VTAAAGAAAAAASVGTRWLAHEGKTLPFFDENHELGLGHRLVVEGRRILANAVYFFLNALKLAIRPAVNAMVATELFERGEADAEIFSNLLLRDIEILLKFF